MKKRNINGVMFIFLGSIFGSTGGLCTKLIPWHSLSIACARGGICALFLCLVRKQWKMRPTKQTLLCGICYLLTGALFMLANKMTTAANAIVLEFTAPIYVIVIVALYYKMRPKLLDLITAVIVLCGMSLFFIEHLGHGALAGDILALLSGVTCAGIYFFSSLPEADPLEAIYIGCLGNIIWLPMFFVDEGFRGSMFDLKVWAVVLFLAIFQYGMSGILFSKGIRTTSPIVAVIAAAIEPILNPLWVFFVVREAPGPLALCGAAVVILTIAGYNILTTLQQKKVRQETAV